MAEERKQSPHYIPELDPESDHHDAAPDRPYGLMVAAALLFVGMALTYFGVNAGNKISLYGGFFIIAVTVLEAALGLFLHRKRNPRDS